MVRNEDGPLTAAKTRGARPCVGLRSIAQEPGHPLGQELAQERWRLPAAQGRPRPQPRRAAGQFPGRRPPPRSLGAPQSIFSVSGPTFLSYPQLGHGVFPVPPQRALSMSNLPHTSDPCPSLLPIQPFPAPLWESLSSCRNLTPAPPGCGLGPPVDPGGLPLNWKRVLSRG